MTRTTVYNGQPWDDDPDVLADLFHNHGEDAHDRAVTIETTAGEEFHIPADEAVDIYIAGEEVED